MNRRTWLASTMGVAALVGGKCLIADTLAGEARDRPKEAPTAPVGIQRCGSFEPQALRRSLDAVLDAIGGIKTMVQNKTVTIKINLTGLEWKPLGGMPAFETYQTHPNTVAVLCAALADAGARRIVVVENLYWDKPFEKVLKEAGWDVAAIAAAGNNRVTFEDTRNRGQWPGYSRFKVPWGGFVYPAFDLNQRFEKTDVLVSLAKLKQHACAGVTGAVKNFFGNTPSSLYGNDAPNENPKDHRTGMFHDGVKKAPAGVPAEIANDAPHDGRFRVPRIVADIFGARPSDLNIIDGIRTIRGGEGHWNGGVAIVEPKLLLAGRNGVCTDAVATGAMGFDPMAPRKKFPFPGDNHLQLLAEKGIGTNDLKNIEIAGLALKDAVFPFQPKRTKES